jgi:hypothetical protein
MASFLSVQLREHTLSGTHAKKQLNLYEIAHVQLRAWSAGLRRGNNTHYLPARQLITALVSNSRFASIGSPIVVAANRKNKI